MGGEWRFSRQKKSLKMQLLTKSIHSQIIHYKRESLYSADSVIHLILTFVAIKRTLKIKSVYTVQFFQVEEFPVSQISPYGIKLKFKNLMA